MSILSKTNTLVAAVVLPAMLLAGCGADPPAPPPNVVLVVVDTLRADHLGHYGYERPTAVALDDFAAKAARFTDCTAPSPWTNPSVASLFSGMETARHGSNEFGAALSTEILTMAELMQAAGWHTAAISFNPGIRSELDYDQGFDDYDEYLGRSSKSPDISEMVARVVRWLDRRPDRPFLLYLQPMNVHGPYRVPEEHLKALLGREPGRGFRYYGDAMTAIMRRGELRMRDEISNEDLQSLADQYDTAVRYSCDQLALLFEILDQRDLFDDSLVIVTADHGEELFDHGGFSHGYSLHREVLQVPLYLKLPRQHQARVVDSPCSLIDLLPTVVEVLGITDEVARDGRSLLPLLAGTSRKEARHARSRIHQAAWWNRCVGRSIQTDRYKLIEIESNYEGLSDAVRLYDLVADPAEEVDLAAERPELVARLRSELEQRFATAAGRAVAEPEMRLDELDLERLRALGYVLDGHEETK